MRWVRWIGLRICRYELAASIRSRCVMTRVTFIVHLLLFAPRPTCPFLEQQAATVAPWFRFWQITIGRAFCALSKNNINTSYEIMFGLDHGASQRKSLESLHSWKVKTSPMPLKKIPALGFYPGIKKHHQNKARDEDVGIDEMTKYFWKKFQSTIFLKKKNKKIEWF